MLVAAEGLDDAAEGVVVDFSSEPPVVTDGPYGETKELFGGFWILDVASKEEAVEWAKRAPMTGPGHEDRDPPGPEHRRVPAGQRVGPEGAGVARGDRPALSPSRRPDGRPSRRSGGSSPPASSARSPATPATSRSPRTSPRRRWPRRWSPGRATAYPATRGLAADASAGAGPIDAYRRRAALDERYAALARDLGEGGRLGGRRRSGAAARTTCCGIPTGSTTTCWR